MSADQQATLDAYVGASPSPDPDPSGGDDAHQRDESAPDSQHAALAAIFEQVTGDATFVERQEETPSHDPVEGEFDVTVEDGLGDAADSDLVIGGWI